MSNDQAIYNFLIANGVSKFWADSAINNIRPALSTNSYFVTDLADMTVKVVDQHVDKFTLTCTARFPDMICRDETLFICYTFRGRKGGGKFTHKVVASIV